ncbi:hypothetical protein DRN69_08180 [Candidatus Pacearchaeota archaeon]|nr:MAG: hypothetical protein DRN69_08180 [Candidatus Pacearchaeota archaeon]
MAWILPILATAGAYVAGRAGSGGGIKFAEEIGTKKEMKVYAPFQPFIYQPHTEITTTTITRSPYAQVKKESAPTWTTPLTQTISPIQGSGAIGSPDTGAGGFNIWDMVIIGGIGLGAYYLIKK